MVLAGAMSDSSAAAETGDVTTLHANLARDGYLYLPQLLPRARVLAAMHRFVSAVDGAVHMGSTGPGDVRLGAGGAGAVGLDNGIVRPEKADALMGDPAVRQVLGCDALVSLLEILMGEEVVAFDHKWFRLVLPGGQTPFHMDSVFFGRSRRAGPLDAAGLHTVWLPWNDLPPDAGGLLLLEGSHRLPGFERMIKTYGMQYDSCGSDIDTPYVSDNAALLSSFDPQARWVSGHGSESGDALYRAGDVVLFSRFMIHGSLENGSTDYVRLSSDVRFQPVSDPVDYRHSATPGRKLTHPSQDEEYMHEMHKRFDRLKASTHEGPTRTMEEALAEWGVSRQALL